MKFYNAMLLLNKGLVLKKNIMQTINQIIYLHLHRYKNI